MRTLIQSDTTVRPEQILRDGQNERTPNSPTNGINSEEGYTLPSPIVTHVPERSNGLAGKTPANGATIIPVATITPNEENIAHERGKEAKTSAEVAPSLEDAGVPHTLEGLECLLKEKPEYSNERDPVVLIDAVAALPDAFFVPTREEMIETMKTKGLEPDTTAPPPPQRNTRSAASKKNEPCEIEITMRRIQRAPLNEGYRNWVQLWVSERSKLMRYYPEYEPVEIYQICSWLQWEGYFSYDPPEEEVERVLKEMIKEVNRAKRRHNKRQKEEDTRR